MRKIIFCFMALIILTGCKPNVPEPEAITAEAAEIKKQTLEFKIKHIVNGKNVLVECMSNDIHFSDIGKNNKGKILVYVNGQLFNEYKTAAFIVKDLKVGTYKLKVEIVDMNNKPYGISKEFLVTII